MNDNVVDLKARRKRPAIDAAVVTLPPLPDPPQGPFTLTVTSEHGKMFEVTFPDHTGDLPLSTPMLGAIGCQDTLANLLAGAVRAFLGRP